MKESKKISTELTDANTPHLGFTGAVTYDQIEAWKKEKGVDKIKFFKVENSVCYLRVPDRKTIAAAMKLGDDPMRYADILITNSWLGGDEAIKKTDRLYMGLFIFIKKLVDIAEGEMGEL